MPPPGISSYFIALIPPEPLREQLHAIKLRIKEEYQSKGALNSPPHITLHMPFEWKDAKEEKLIASLKQFADEREKFQVIIQGFSCFPPRVIFADIPTTPALQLLQKELHSHCKRDLNLFNAQYRDLPFHPHITLAFRDLKKDTFEKAWTYYREQNFSGEFITDRITLLKKDEKEWMPLADFFF